MVFLWGSVVNKANPALSLVTGVESKLLHDSMVENMVILKGTSGFS